MPGGIQPPLEVVLTWPIPNYVSPPTRSPYVLIVACVLGPISTVLLFARLWVRIRMQRNAGLDDWLMLASLIPILGVTVLCPLMVEKYRFDRHVWDIGPKYFPIQRKFVMAMYCTFTLASGLVKMSVLLFYRRLSSRAVSPTSRWIMRIMMVIIGGYTMAFIVVIIFACRPISAFWDQVNFDLKFNPQYKYYCIDEGADILANGIISTVQDFIVAFLPTLLCWKLQMPVRQKIALYSIFAVSYTTVAIGSLRTYTSYRIYFETYDVTWAAGDSFLFTLLEIHIGAMCANAPALKVFFKHILQSERLTKLISSRSSKSRSNGSKSKISTEPTASTSTRVSKTSAWIPIGFWKSSHSRNASGYLSSTNTTVTTDKHGGIVHKANYDQRDSSDLYRHFAPEYHDTIISYEQPGDIEMGALRSYPQDKRESDIQALPPLPTPSSPSWLRPIRSISPFPKL